jgi:hypothetical protein
VGWERTSFFIAALRWRDTVGFESPRTLAMSARLFNLVLEKNRGVQHLALPLRKNIAQPQRRPFQNLHIKPLRPISSAIFLAVICLGDKMLILRGILTPEMSAEEMLKEVIRYV